MNNKGYSLISVMVATALSCGVAVSLSQVLVIIERQRSEVTINNNLLGYMEGIERRISRLFQLRSISVANNVDPNLAEEYQPSTQFYYTYSQTNWSYFSFLLPILNNMGQWSAFRTVIVETECHETATISQTESLSTRKLSAPPGCPVGTVPVCSTRYRLKITDSTSGITYFPSDADTTIRSVAMCATNGPDRISTYSPSLSVSLNAASTLPSKGVQWRQKVVTFHLNPNIPNGLTYTDKQFPALD